VTRKETFRVKPYAHLNYKFVVRAKLDGKWRRSYFKSEEEATTYARDQNAAASRQIDGGDRTSNVGQGDSPSKTLAGSAPNQRLAISSATGARKAVVILGMHRSGTSALCGALDLVGVDFGDHLMPANDANVKGYWEHEEVVRQHDDLLASLGSNWDDDRPLPSNWIKRKTTRDVRARLLGILERDFGHSSLFGLKDPRMCRLMALWLPIFQTMRVEPHFVIVVRHPWEVAESLAKRDGIEHPKSYLLWLEHVVQAESATRGHKRSFVRYEEMVDDPVAILTKLRKQLGINLRAPSRTRDSLRNFLDPSLRHHELTKTEAGKLRHPIPQIALDLYETIRNAATSREIERKVEPLVTQFIRGCELFYPRIELVEVQPGSPVAEAVKSKKTRNLVDPHDSLLQDELKEKSEQVAHFQSEAEEKSKHVIVLQGNLKKKSQQVAILHEAAQERSRQVANLQRDLEERANQIGQLQSETDRQFQLLEQLKNQLETATNRLAHFKDEVLDARSETLKSRGILDFKQTSCAGLERYNSILEERLGNISRQLLTVARALQRLDSDSALEAIRHAISSEKTSPGDAAIEMAANRLDGKVTPALLFHAPWYLGQYPDVAHSDVDPLKHYLRWGAREGRKPNPVFDTLWYLARNPDVAAGGLNPLEHYLDCGAREGRDPGPFFDTSWYLADNPDVKSAGLNPLQHYLEYGAREERAPHPLFDSVFYRKQNPELTGLDALDYYIRWGAAGGHSPHPLFDAAWYLAQNPDIAGRGVNPLLHYLEAGWRESRNPHPLFDSDWYLAENPDLVAAGMNPLVHYIKSGAAEGRKPNPLFDSAWYNAQDPELEVKGINPLAHYVLRGAAEGRDPNPFFSTAWYISQNPELTLSGENPLVHYRAKGGEAGRDPHPIFDSKYYLFQHPDADRTGLTPLEHYLLFGAKTGRTINPLFDADYYRDTYLKGLTEWVDPVQHYLDVGWELGYRPNPTFDPGFYLHVHRDVAEAGLEPFAHYLQSGLAEERITTAEALSFELRQPEFKIPREPVLLPNTAPSDVKGIAFYLPQFHTIPQNDLWWGKGFTEWTNVRGGTSNFEGHYQPHVPAGLGYYDLSSGEVLEKQAELARAAGLHGFCFYYYWFGGEVLLDLPVRRMVETGKPAFPFCICWANENWTRRWDGKDSDILIAQRHSAEDDLAFIRHIETIIRSENYIRIEGKPLLLVYRPSLLPDAKATLQRWRTHVREAGLGELHLVMVQSFSEGVSPADYGFDAVVQFPPHLPSTPVTPVIREKAVDFTGYIYDYDEVRHRAIGQLRAPSSSTLYPGVMPSWDNTARQRQRSSIWVNSSPEAYSEWLAEAVSLARARLPLAERFVFINAWNEWAEGCHLEPDERFGYAWLNATRLALQQPSLAPAISTGAMLHPEPPPPAPITVRPLAGTIRLVISVLFYHREDILTAFITNLLPQLRMAAQAKDLSCELFLSFNYEPSPGTLSDLQQLIAQLLPSSESSVHIIENRFNLGFGAGHNAIFEKTASDVFIILNSDLHLEDEHWLTKSADRFRNSDVAILGLAGNASRLREDGCGIPVGETGAPFDFVDGSALAVRSDLATQFGLFAPSFDYFYFEDVDLNLRYRQMGLRIETLDLPCLHERSSSTQLLPKFAVESVLNRNRARFFERWGRYLTTRRLTNRLALRFRNADRQLQCSSLAAIFGLLAEHPTAVLDLWGVHEQLVPLFQHPRIRLIPWWQTQRPEDYLRSYELSLDATSPSPLAVRIAEQMLVDPAFDLARHHLESLVSRDALEGEHTNRAVVYLGRPQILFEGKQPETESLLAAQEPLLQRGFVIQYHSEYGLMEISAIPQSERRNWKYVARSNGLDLLADLAAADVLITSDGWAAELGQLLNKRTMIWLGATSAEAVIWNTPTTHSFFDPLLSCLGCHERFGHIGRNVCLRGDEACMSSRLNETFVQTIEKFLDGERVITTETRISSAHAVASRIKRSDQEKLEAWPETSAGSVLVLTPVNPTLDPAILRRARELAERAIKGMRGCRIVHDDAGEAPLRGQPHPYRQAAIAKIRQNMIDRHLRDERWVFWVDADLVEYPANLVEELISRAEGGIAAPLVLMEGDLSEPAYPAGFGPGRFYDIAGFIENGRWARFTQPYFDQIGPVYELDSVGSCYLANADLYRGGAKHTVDHATNSFISNKSEWSADAIQKNQSGPANSYTEHYSVCEFTREAGLPVRAFADLIAFHQKT
jgi:GT2 family glycosyltransferase